MVTTNRIFPNQSGYKRGDSLLTLVDISDIRFKAIDNEL